MTRRRGQRQAGFTLVELMVSLALAGILIAGAFQIHTVFNAQSMRQNQLTDLQQSLRMSMALIERAIRNSGAGLVNGKATITPGCAGTRDLYRVQYYDGLGAAWPPPQNVASQYALFDNTPGDVHTGSDVLRVILPESAQANWETLETPTQLTMSGTNKFADNTTLVPGDVLLYLNSVTAGAHGCLRQVTGIVGVTTPNGVTTLTVPHVAAADALCVNADTSCAIPVPPAGMPVRVLRNQTYFRVVQPTVGGNPNLMMATMPISDPPQAQPTWMIIADDIEDMQVAMLMADGSVCNDRDVPTPQIAGGVCDPSLAVAFRVTLVGATQSSVPGTATSVTGAMQYKGGYEDESVVGGVPISPADGKLRRALTSEIVLRN